MAIRGSSLAGVTIPLGGPAGLPGQSAYAAWLQLGNAGSLAAFIASLKGDPGGVTTLAGKIGALGLDDINALAKNGDASNATATAGGATERLGSVYARVVNYASRAAAAAAVIPAVMVQVTLGGYAVQGDGGDARYVAVATQPTHLGKFQSADGRWWAIAEKRLRPEMFGGAGDDTTDNLGPVNAAMGVFAYQNTGGPSGGQIEFLGASYAFSGSVNTNGRHGLGLFGGGINRSQLRATGNFPVFVDIGTATSGTAEVEIGYMKIVGGGKNNANAHGIQWNYSYNGKIHDVFFYGCNHCLDISNVWQVNLFRVRGDGTGVQQSNVGLYMAEADPTNPVINNTVNATDVIFSGNAQYNFRLINFQGSKFVSCEGGAAGNINWYLGDPTTGNAPCQWGHFSNILADTAPNGGFVLKQGNASELSQIFFANMWIGNIYDAGGGIGLSIDGGQDITICSLLAVKTVTAIRFNNCARINVHGTIKNYNIADTGQAASWKPAIGLTGSVDCIFLLTTSTAYTVTGYNGYVEDANSYRNRLYGLGPANGALSLAFGGAGAGLAYGTGGSNGCIYEVEGTIVRVQFLMTLTSKGSSTGVATLSGLPFASTGGAAGYGSFNPILGAAGMAGLTALFAQTGPGSKSATLVQQGATGSVNATDANFTNTSVITGAITYLKQ